MLLAITDAVEPSFVIIIKGFDNPSYSTTYMTLSSWDLVHETSYSLAAATTRYMPIHITY